MVCCVPGLCIILRCVTQGSWLWGVCSRNSSHLIGPFPFAGSYVIAQAGCTGACGSPGGGGLGTRSSSRGGAAAGFRPRGTVGSSVRGAGLLLWPVVLPPNSPVLPPMTRMMLANGCPSVCCSQQSGGWCPRSRAEDERAAQVAQSRALPSDGHPASPAWPRFLRASHSESVIYYEDPPGRRSDQGPLTVSPKFRSHPSPSLRFRFLLLLLFA